MKAQFGKFRAVSLLILTLGGCVSKPIGAPGAQPVSWEFIQAVGGIRLGEMYSQDGRYLVPVIVDLSGAQTITVKPTLRNTGVECAGIATDGSGNLVTGFNLWITVYSQSRNVTRGASRGCGDILLPPNFGPADYNVYYEEKRKIVSIFNTKEHHVGSIR